MSIGKYKKVKSEKKYQKIAATMQIGCQHAKAWDFYSFFIVAEKYFLRKV